MNDEPVVVYFQIRFPTRCNKTCETYLNKTKVYERVFCLNMRSGSATKLGMTIALNNSCYHTQ